MSRALSSGLEAALQSDSVKPIVLVAAYFDTGTTRLWSGTGELTWNSQTWSGTGGLLNIGTIEEPREIKANGIRVSLSGIPAELLALALSDEYQGRALEVYLGALSETYSVITDPVILFRGLMDIMSIAENGDTATITLTVENRLIDLERSRTSRYTAEDQNIKYPADRGFDFVPDMQDKNIKWGGG